jgi:hypothetical protein
MRVIRAMTALWLRRPLYLALGGCPGPRLRRAKTKFFWLELAGRWRHAHRTLTAASSPGGPMAVDDQIAVRRDDPDVVFAASRASGDCRFASDFASSPLSVQRATPQVRFPGHRDRSRPGGDSGW